MRSKKKKNILVHGCDISINHGAILQLRNGKLDNFWYYTDKAGSAKRSKKHGFRIEIPSTRKQPDKQIRSLMRFEWVCNWIENILINNKPHYSSLEDYAVSASQGAHYLGEIGGQVRRLLWINNIPFRLHDPTTVKMFITHDGTADKDLMEECIERRWGVNFDKYNLKGKKLNKQTSQDLTDAYGMAKMTWIEYLLRKGRIRQSKLHEKELRAFNRVTRANPVNILGRGWICK